MFVKWIRKLDEDTRVVSLRAQGEIFANFSRVEIFFDKKVDDERDLLKDEVAALLLESS